MKYGTVLQICWNQYSQYSRKHPEMSSVEIYNFIHDRYSMQFNSDPNNISKMASLRAWELWYSDFKKEFLHIFFLETKLKEILENIKVKLDNAKEYVKENGNSELMWSDKYKGNIEVQTFCFGIHLPNIKHGYAFKLMLYDNRLITYLSKDDFGGSEISEENYLNFCKSTDEKTQRIVHIFQLCINTILYMACYPDCIIEGVPNDLTSIKNCEKKCKLAVSDDFKEIIESGGVKSPYMKGMYFMTFRDERYTKMRGKTITVKAQFIKGKAVTAKTSSDFSKLDEDTAEENRETTK